MSQTIGPVILDLIGPDISQEERELLQHPLVGGIILFSRHYQSPAQITDLCRAIRLTRKTPLLISVDQEGGRVQRFKDGFIRLPSMGEVGKLYQESPQEGLTIAHCCGWLMAAELLAAGIDFSFAPVLDLDKKLNTVVGDRSFGETSATVTVLATALMQGMHEAGMAATGKHFPGHGSVNVDSHLDLPVDSRTFADIQAADLEPFVQLIKAGINAIMPAHILFPNVDDRPVGFSPHWLQKVLRQDLNFSGVIFSDDLNMAGAGVAGGYADRATAALSAGCDMVLICNNRPGAIEILDQLSQEYTVSIEKWQQLQGKSSDGLSALHASHVWKNYYNSFVQYRKLHENHQ
ncbi:MAG: beta-N-acetylhexosaminidase [Gammaproteobacteria bacterium]